MQTFFKQKQMFLLLKIIFENRIAFNYETNLDQSLSETHIIRSDAACELDKISMEAN